MRFRVLLLCLALFAPYSHAEIAEHLDYDDYPANAGAGGSLLDILNAASPLREDGRIVHSHTQWQVKWNFHSMLKRGMCRITRVDVTVTGKITLPRLVGGNPELRGKFEKYLPALRTHELGHYENGRNAAADIERRMLALPEMSSCNALQDAANNLGDSTVDFYAGKDKEYDHETLRGKTQGAWLAD